MGIRPGSRSPLLQLHRISWKLLRLTTSINRGLWVGSWLGLLSRRHLHELDAEYYTGSGSYPSAEHNQAGLFGWEKEVINEFFGGCRQVAILGAGAGRELFPLLERGCAVHAFECHAGLREAGNALLTERGLEPRIEAMDRDLCPPLQRPVDGVIVGWGMYTLVQGREQRIRLLSDLRKATRAGGPLLLSFYVRAGDRRPYKIGASLGTLLRRLTGRARVEYGDFLSPGYCHFFNREELEAELREGGWTPTFFSQRTYPHAVALAGESNRDHPDHASE